MKIVIRNTESGLVVGQYVRVTTKTGTEVSIFEALQDHTVEQTPTELVVTNEMGIRVHKLWPKAARTSTTENGRESVRIADSAWLNKDSHGTTYISCYAADRPSEFSDIDI